MNGWQIVVYMLLSPFFGVGLFFFIRTRIKTYRQLKKSIKSGVWEQNFNYKFQGKYKTKLDKYVLKQGKKSVKKENKKFNNEPLIYNKNNKEKK